jgi:hypothetical protein
VSESLAAGTPAICTDRCGAAMVATAAIWRADAGATPPLVVARPTVASLAVAVRAAAEAGPPSLARRYAIHAGMESLAPAAAAGRFLDAVLAL